MIARLRLFLATAFSSSHQGSLNSCFSLPSIVPYCPSFYLSKNIIFNYLFKCIWVYARDGSCLLRTKAPEPMKLKLQVVVSPTNVGTEQALWSILPSFVL